jgi:cytochrome c553
MSRLFLKIALPMALISGGLMVSTQFTYGKSEYTKKEKKACAFCHTAAGKKDLNDIGKCYAEHGHSLEGCEK